jgi:hypothetical protein
MSPCIISEAKTQEIDLEEVIHWHVIVAPFAGSAVARV